jgi:hypothetical protein
MYGQSTKWTVVRAAELLMDKNPPTGTYRVLRCNLINAECTQGWSKLAKGVQRGKGRWSYHPNELQFMFVTAAQVSYSNLALFMLVECVEAEKYLNAIVAVSE